MGYAVLGKALTNAYNTVFRWQAWLRHQGNEHIIILMRLESSFWIGKTIDWKARLPWVSAVEKRAWVVFRIHVWDRLWSHGDRQSVGCNIILWRALPLRPVQVHHSGAVWEESPPALAAHIEKRSNKRNQASMHQPQKYKPHRRCRTSSESSPGNVSPGYQRKERYFVWEDEFRSVGNCLLLMSTQLLVFTLTGSVKLKPFLAQHFLRGQPIKGQSTVRWWTCTGIDATIPDQALSVYHQAIQASWATQTKPECLLLWERWPFQVSTWRNLHSPLLIISKQLIPK